MKKKRLFMAIPLPNNIKETLMEAAQIIENDLPAKYLPARLSGGQAKGLPARQRLMAGGWQAGKLYIGQAGQIKWVPKQNLHITLLFLGKKDESELSEIISKIENVTKQCTAFSLNLVEILTIIKKRKPVMIWAEFDRNKHFTNLVTKCSQILEIQPDHDLRPHITLARIKYGKSRGKSVSNPAFESNSLENFKLEVMTIHLWESVLTSKQAVYKSVKSFKLI